MIMDDDPHLVDRVSFVKDFAERHVHLPKIFLVEDFDTNKWGEFLSSSDRIDDQNENILTMTSRLSK